MLDKQKEDALLKQLEKSTVAASHTEASFKRLQQVIELSELDEEESASLFVLALQYRLDAEDVIKALIAADKNLCAALGIARENTRNRNLDLLHYYLGKSNTAHDFAILLDLDGELLKALSLNDRLAKLLSKERKRLERLAKRRTFDEDRDDNERHDNKDTKSKGYAHYGALGIAKQLKEALGFQGLFHFCLQELTEALQEFGHIPKFGIQYDYLVGLKGPISRFYTAYLHGIGLCESILQHLDKKLPKLEKARGSLLHQALKKMLTQKNHELQTLINQSNERLYQATRLENELEKASLESKFNDAAYRRRTMRWF